MRKTDLGNIHCRHLIAEIGKITAKHSGFSEEKLDFIISYDIKYRKAF
jgi:hypothetical protein